MKKIVAITALGALCVVGTAQADKPPKPAKPAHPTNPASCTPHAVGYKANGTLVSSALTPQPGNNLYSGTLTVNVLKANHKGATGSQTFTLTNARVKFGKNVNPASPAPGSRVNLRGKITQLHNKNCSTSGFTPTTTVTRADVKLTKTK